jgi:hypothetical protein
MPPIFRQPLKKRETRASRLFVGVLFLFIAIGSSATVPRPDNVPRALGQLIGVAILIGPAIWLIASGLPNTMWLKAAQRRARRRIWYGLAGTGLLVMVGLEFLLAYIGWFIAGVLVAWAYWLGWTWISWIIADKKAVERFR